MPTCMEHCDGEGVERAEKTGCQTSAREAGCRTPAREPGRAGGREWKKSPARGDWKNSPTIVLPSSGQHTEQLAIELPSSGHCTEQTRELAEATARSIRRKPLPLVRQSSGVSPRRSTRHQTAEDAPEAYRRRSARESTWSSSEACEQQSVQDASETLKAPRARAVRRTPRRRRERRHDPVDGKAYAWEEFFALYKGKYKQKEVEAYWVTCQPLRGKRGEKAELKVKGKARWKVKHGSRRPRGGSWSGPPEGGEARL